MRLVDRHIINRTHNFWQVCDQLAFKSKNLYNLANYHCRQLQQITYKCQLAGIKVIETEESYTSKTSALDARKTL